MPWGPYRVMGFGGPGSRVGGWRRSGGVWWLKVRLERVRVLSEGWVAPDAVELADGTASDFHIGFSPPSGFEADTTRFELQNPAHGFLTLAEEV